MFHPSTALWKNKHSHIFILFTDVHLIRKHTSTHLGLIKGHVMQHVRGKATTWVWSSLHHLFITFTHRNKRVILLSCLWQAPHGHYSLPLSCRVQNLQLHYWKTASRSNKHNSANWCWEVQTWKRILSHLTRTCWPPPDYPTEMPQTAINIKQINY